MKTISRSLTFAVLFVCITSLWAQVPQMTSYQGKVTVNGVPFTGAGQFKFALVNSNGSASYWSNDGSSVGGSQPAAIVPLGVTNGLFSVMLGKTDIIGMTVSIPINIFTNLDTRLRTWFNDGVIGWQQLLPDQRIGTVGYASEAAMAAQAMSLAPGVGNSGTVVQINTGPGLTGGPITTNGTISIANGAVVNSMLQNSTVAINPGSGLSGGGTVSLGGSTTVSIANGGVINAMLANSTLTITAGNGLGGGGSVSLGGTATLSANLGHDSTLIGNGGSTALGLNVNNPNNWVAQQTFSKINSPATDSSGNGVITMAGVRFLHAYGTGNVFLGNSAGNLSMGGNYNTAIGFAVLGSNTTGNNNTANGANALTQNISGNENTAVGSNALQDNSDGVDNVAVGVDALLQNTHGSLNTAVGREALAFNVIGSNNVALGNFAGALVSAGNNNIHIAHMGVTGDNGTIRIGTQGAQTTTFIAGIYGSTASAGSAVYINSAGQLGTITSSRQFKENIRNMEDASRVLYELQPVTFRYKPDLDPRGTPQFGLVAEEVDKVDPDLVIRDANHSIYTVRYEAVNAMLLNEFLKEHHKVTEQEDQIAVLQRKVAQLDLLEKRLLELEHTIGSIRSKQ